MNEALAQGAARVGARRSGSRRWTPSSSPSATTSPSSSSPSYEESIKARLAVQQSQVDQARAVMRLKQRQRDELKVRAGLDGMLQRRAGGSRPAGRARHEPRPRRESRPAEGGDQDRGDAGQGHSDRPEGQRSTRATASSPASSPASIRRCRTARSPWTSALVGDLPRGAVPDLSVDGTDRARADGRRRVRGPAGVRPGTERRRAVQGSTRRQRHARAGEARPHLGERRRNRLGPERRRQVVLSDMSAWDAFDRVRLQ